MPALMMTLVASVIDWGMAFWDAVLVGNGYVLPSTTTDENSAEVLWPEMRVWLSGATVESPMTKPSLKAFIMDWPSMRMGFSVGYVGRT